MSMDFQSGTTGPVRYGSVERCISGAQTGADSAVSVLRKRLGLPIGGWVPRGWRTERGAQPQLASFGFVETASADYTERTRRNVEDADATAIFATQARSPGTTATVRFATDAHKPWILIDPRKDAAAERLVEWLEVIRPRTLNVAGNRESKSPGIAAQTAGVLIDALRWFDTMMREAP